MAMRAKPTKTADIIPIRKGVAAGVEKATSEGRSLQGVIRADFIQSESDPLDLSVTTDGDLRLIQALLGDDSQALDDEARYNAWLEMHYPIGGARIYKRKMRDGTVVEFNSSIWGIRPASNSPAAFKAAVEDTKRRYAERIAKAETRKLMQQSAMAGYGPYRGFKYSMKQVGELLDRRLSPRSAPVDFVVSLLQQHRDRLTWDHGYQRIPMSSTTRRFVNEVDALRAFPGLHRNQDEVVQASQPERVPAPDFSPAEIEKATKAGVAFMGSSAPNVIQDVGGSITEELVQYRVAQDQLIEAANDTSAVGDEYCIVSQLNDQELSTPYALSDSQGYMDLFGNLDSTIVRETDELFYQRYGEFLKLSSHLLSTPDSVQGETPHLTLVSDLKPSAIVPANPGTPPEDLDADNWLTILDAERVKRDHEKAQQDALEVDEINRYVLQAWNMSQRLPPPRLDETVEEYVDVIDKWLGDKPSPVKMAKAFVPLNLMPRVQDELMAPYFEPMPDRQTIVVPTEYAEVWEPKAPNIDKAVLNALFQQALSDLLAGKTDFMGPPEPIYVDGSEIIWNNQPRGIILLNSTTELDEKGKVIRQWWPGRTTSQDDNDPVTSEAGLVRKAALMAQRAYNRLKNPPKKQVHVLNKIVLHNGDELFVPVYGGKQPS